MYTYETGTILNDCKLKMRNTYEQVAEARGNSPSEDMSGGQGSPNWFIAKEMWANKNNIDKYISMLSMIYSDEIRQDHYHYHYHHHRQQTRTESCCDDIRRTKTEKDTIQTNIRTFHLFAFDLVSFRNTIQTANKRLKLNVLQSMQPTNICEFPHGKQLIIR